MGALAWKVLGTSAAVGAAAFLPRPHPVTPATVRAAASVRSKYLRFMKSVPPPGVGP